MPSQRWIDRQVQALIAIGVDAADAQAVVQRANDLIPPDEDEDAWIPGAGDVYDNPASAESINDSRIAWYSSPHVDAKYKRILDSRVADG